MKIKFQEHEQEFDNKIDFAKWFAGIAHQEDSGEIDKNGHSVMVPLSSKYVDGDIHIGGLPCGTGASNEDEAWEVLADRWLLACQVE